MDAKTIDRILEACRGIAYAREESATNYADRYAIAHQYLSLVRCVARDIVKESK